MPHRRRTGGVRQDPLCGQRPDTHPGRGVRRAGPLHRRPSVDRILGGRHRGHRGGLRGGHHRCRSDRSVHRHVLPSSWTGGHRDDRHRPFAFGVRARPRSGGCRRGSHGGGSGGGSALHDRRPGCGHGDGGRRRQGDLRDGLEDRPPQRHRRRGRDVRGAADSATTGHVREEPCVQDRRGGRVPLQGADGPDIIGCDRPVRARHPQVPVR